MPNVYAWMPVHASAKFYIEKPELWDEMSDAEKELYFAENSLVADPLCCHCMDNFETMYEMDLDAPDKFIEYHLH